jgi:LmbE family N-acetylglucosaminyl deacetylase
MLRKFSALLFSLCLFSTAFTASTVSAQVQDLAYNQGATAAWQALIRLRTTATVLFTQAHPDDEDAALVTWMARRAGARTGILSINRGEGGANLIGPELYDALGILRTEEFLAACRYYGVQDLMFTRMADFGYSKRLDETLEHWGKENVLRDMVRAVRTYRPDIIISRFHGKARDGHGNHQAAGLLSLEIFKIAADPQMFPEEGKPWQVKKLYLSTRGNEASTLKINTGEYDPLLGKSCRQIGSEGYGLHRSQAMGQPRIPAGDFFSALQLTESTIPKVENEQSVFDGIGASLTALAKEYLPLIDLRAELFEADNAVEIAIGKFNAREPWTIAEELASGMRNIRKAIEKAEKSTLAEAQKDHLLFLLRNKEIEFNDAMNKALGLSLEALVEPDKPATNPMGFMQARETFRVAIPGQKFNATSTLTNRSEVPIRLESFSGGNREPGIHIEIISDGMTSFGKILRRNESAMQKMRIGVDLNAEGTKIPWFRDSELRDHFYKLRYKSPLALPFESRHFTAAVFYRVSDVSFRIDRSLQTSFIARPYGEERRLLTIAPAINVQMTPRVGVVALNTANSETTVTVNVSSNAKGEAKGTVRLRVPEGWKATPSEQPFHFQREGEKSNFTFKVSVPTVKAGTDYKVQAVAEYDGQEFSEGYQVIAYRDLEPRHLYRDAVMTIRGVDVKVAPDLHIGYVMGVGDKVPEALQQIGVKVTMLGAGELADGNLNQFDAILIGIRASAVREDLKAYNKRLLDYVERGGNLIWQYQTPEFDEIAYGPYPYKMGRNPEEVSEEDSQVTILDPANPVFNWPNKITTADFSNWVEERGSKWWGEWDARYKPLLECHDRQQPEQRGGMMQAQSGKGTFTYAGYAFYRQLPAGVEGAYRLFANLISLKKMPK